MHKKQLYMAPEAESLVVQIEGVICESGDFPARYHIPSRKSSLNLHAL